jgi:hypothetical protein
MKMKKYLLLFYLNRLNIQNLLMSAVKKIILIFLISIFTYSCVDTVPRSAYYSSEMDNKYNYVAEYRNVGGADETILGILSLGLSTYNRVNQPHVAYGNTMEEAKLNALNKCKLNIRNNALNTGHVCKLYSASPTLKTNSGIVETSYFEESITRYKDECSIIGFKPDTDKFAQCVFELKKTEMQIALAKQENTNYNNDDTLKNLLILNESMKLLNPARNNFSCQARPFGIYTNIYCN